MRILITGGHGFIGSEVVRQAIAAGHSVLNIDKMTYAASGTALNSVEGEADYSFRKVDICNRAALDTCFEDFQPEAVMHLAAESHVDRSITGPAAFMETNVTGTFHMLEAARKYWEDAGRVEAFRFLHVSTDEVFGSLGATGAFSETTPYQPHSPYSASKASSDHLVRAWADTYGLPVLISNCSNNFGPFQFPEKLIPLSLLNALSGKAIGIYGTGENVRDWLHVSDHARALFLILERGALGETYCVGGHGERSNIEVIHKLCAILDAKRPDNAPHTDLITFITDRLGHDFRYAIDATKITRDLGWHPQHDFDDGLAATVDWYIANEAWWSPLQSSN